jgi:fatty acid desaturase
MKAHEFNRTSKIRYVEKHRLSFDCTLTLLMLLLPFVFTKNFGWFAIPVNTLVGGLGLFRCWLLAHEAGHKTALKNKFGNEILGIVFSLPTLYPFAALARAHQFHHAYLSVRNLDTTL